MKGKREGSAAISVAQLFVMETSLGGGGRGGNGLRTEVMLRHQRKKPAVSLGPPPTNQELCNAAGESNALCFIFQPESSGVGNRGCFFGEQSRPAACRKLEGHLRLQPVPLAHQGC